MSSRVVLDNYRDWFGRRTERPLEKLLIADKRVKAMEWLFKRRLVVRSPEKIKQQKEDIISYYPSEKLADELIDIILHSEPSFWLANDLFYRGVVAAYKEIRPRL